MPRTFAPSKKDTTQPAIEAAFKRAGWSLVDTHALGDDAPDLFVSYGRTTIAIECKTGKRKRTPGQIVWADNWQGYYLSGNDPLQLLTDARNIIAEANGDDD